jgi:oligopeptide transport system substrate-binding protein
MEIMKKQKVLLLSLILVLAVLAAMVPGCGGGAKIQISDLKVSPSEVVSNQEAAIEATLTNSGSAAGNYTAVLKVNDIQVDSRDINLAKGEIKNVSFNFKAATGGQYKIDVNGLTGTIQVRETQTAVPPQSTQKPAEFKVASLEITPAAVIAGSTLSINASITNSGEVAGTYTAKLTLDGKLLEEKAVPCAAGATQKVTFTASISASGNHTLELGGTRKSFEVASQPFRVKSILAAPVEVLLGATTTVEAEVVNEGTAKDTQTLTLQVNGADTDSQSLTLEAGQGSKVTFKLVRNVAGKYTLKIGDAALDINYTGVSPYSSQKYLYTVNYPASWTKLDTVPENVLFSGNKGEKVRVTISLLDVDMTLDEYAEKEKNDLLSAGTAAKIISSSQVKRENSLFGLRQEYSFSQNNTAYTGTNLLVKRGRYCFNVQAEAQETAWKEARPRIDAVLESFQPPVVAVGSYTDSASGFSITLPKGWDGISTGKKTPSLVIYSTVNEQSIVSQIMIDSSTGGITARDYINSVMEQIKQHIQDIKIVSEGEKKIGEYSGYSILFTGNISSSSVKTRMLSFVRGSQVYTLLSQTITSYFDEKATTINNFFNSFNLVEIKLYDVSRQDSLFLWEGDIVTLDPAISEEGPGGIVGAIFSSLVQLDKNSQPIPDLAEKWDISSDKLVYTFHLRKNASFHDGKAVTAKDVKYSWERACSPATASPKARTYLGDIAGAVEMLDGKAAEISGLKVIDDLTLQVTLDGPKPYFLAKIAQTTAFIVDQVNVAKGGNWYSQANGSGPFKIKQWDKGKTLVLERYDKYYLGPAKLKNIVFRIFGGLPVTMYENAEIDIAQVSFLEKDKVTDPANPLNKDLLTNKEPMTGYLGFNVTLPPFDDLKVRQAFAQALNMDKLVEVSLKDNVERSGSLLPPGMPGYNPELKPLAFDPVQAKKLLEESRYNPDDFPPVTLYVAYAASPDDEAMVAMWKQNLGVDVKIEVISELEEFYRRRHAREFQVFTGSWRADYLDPQNFLEVLFQSKSQENMSAYSNPEVDAALAAAAMEQDSQKRLMLYREIEKKILDDLPVVPYYTNFISDVLVKPYVKGFSLDNFVKLWKDISIIAH